MTDNARGQLKLQEMSFVLVALMIFFTLVALIFVSVRSSDLRERAQSLKEDAAREAVRKISGSPELLWAGCAGCIDADKTLILKERVKKNPTEADIWQFTYLALEWVYPRRAGGECTSVNYPQCNTTTILRRAENYGVASSAFVTLCRWDAIRGARCELGRVVAAGQEVKYGK